MRIENLEIKWSRYGVHSLKINGSFYTPVAVISAQGGLSVAGGCRCLTKELDMIAC